MTIETIFSKLCIFYNLDEHLNAQLSKWVLWLVFVMSTIKIVSYDESWEISRLKISGVDDLRAGS